MHHTGAIVIGVDLGTTRLRAAVSSGTSVREALGVDAPFPTSVVEVDGRWVCDPDAVRGDHAVVDRWKWLLGRAGPVDAGWIAADVLQQMLPRVRRNPGDAHLGVIAVPAAFDEGARAALSSACRQAGFSLRQMLSESVALACDQVPADTRGHVAAIVGGAGHVEVSILEAGDAVLAARARRSLLTVHGDGYVYALAQRVLQDLGAQAGVDLTVDPALVTSLLRPLEHSLVAWNGVSALRVHLPPPCADRVGARAWEVSRDALAELTTQTSRRLAPCLDAALSDARRRRGDLRAVVISGGLLRAPGLAPWIAERLGAPLAVAGPGAIALGAARHGARLAGRLASTWILHDACTQDDLRLIRARATRPLSTIAHAPSAPTPPWQPRSSSGPRPTLPPLAPLPTPPRPSSQMPLRVASSTAVTQPPASAVTQSPASAATQSPAPPAPTAPAPPAPTAPASAVTQSPAPPAPTAPAPGAAPTLPATPTVTPDAPTPTTSLTQPEVPRVVVTAAPPLVARLAEARATPRVPAAPSIPPLGTFCGVTDVEAFRALPIERTPRPEELAPPTLAALLVLVSSQPEAHGRLTLTTDHDRLELLFVDRGPVTYYAERKRQLRAFSWARGAYAWTPLTPSAQDAKNREPLTSFLASGLRESLRELADESLRATLSPHMPQSPRVPAARRRRANQLGLTDHELRAVDFALDGARALRDLLGDGLLGRATLARLLLLLEVFECLAWDDASTHDAARSRAELAARLERMRAQNHYETLGVHWTDSRDEVRAAWARFDAEYGAAGPWRAVDAGTAARVHALGRDAWATLGDDDRRARYLAQAYPTLDAAALRAMRAHRARGLAARGEGDGAEGE